MRKFLLAWLRRLDARRVPVSLPTPYVPVEPRLPAWRESVPMDDVLVVPIDWARLVVRVDVRGREVR